MCSSDLFPSHDKQVDGKDESIFSIRGCPAEVAPNITWIDDKNMIIHHKINGKEIKTKNEFGWLNPIKITYK